MTLIIIFSILRIFALVHKLYMNLSLLKLDLSYLKQAIWCKLLTILYLKYQFFWNEKVWFMIFNLMTSFSQIKKPHIGHIGFNF